MIQEAEIIIPGINYQPTRYDGSVFRTRWEDVAKFIHKYIREYVINMYYYSSPIVSFGDELVTFNPYEKINSVAMEYINILQTKFGNNTAAWLQDPIMIEFMLEGDDNVLMKFWENILRRESNFSALIGSISTSQGVAAEQAIRDMSEYIKYYCPNKIYNGIMKRIEIKKYLK